MQNHLAVALAASLALFAVGASAAPASAPHGPRFPQPDANPYATTMFDLGVDVSDVPLTRQGVNQFLAGLSPEGQQIMFATCQNYLGDPSQVRTPTTLAFCHVLLDG